MTLFIFPSEALRKFIFVMTKRQKFKRRSNVYISFPTGTDRDHCGRFSVSEQKLSADYLRFVSFLSLPC
jgi:hypothetical protein